MAKIVSTAIMRLNILSTFSFISILHRIRHEGLTSRIIIRDSMTFYAISWKRSRFDKHIHVKYDTIISCVVVILSGFKNKRRDSIFAKKIEYTSDLSKHKWGLI